MVHKTLENTKAENRQSTLTSEQLYKSGVPLVSVRPVKNEDSVLMAVSSFSFLFYHLKAENYENISYFYARFAL